MKRWIAAGKMLAGTLQVANGIRQFFGGGSKMYANMSVRSGKQRIEEGLREWKGKQ